MDQTPVTIVTGGGRGIGRAIALRMARQTAVLVVGRTEKDLADVCSNIAASGGQADYVVADVALPASATLALDKIRERSWVLSNLVCNAGFARGGPLHTFSEAVWREMFDINVHGTFNFIRACLPSMIEQKQGAITIISSILGLKAHKNDTAYSATKFALVGLAQGLAAEVRKYNIAVAAICPGFVNTEMTDRSIQGLVKYQGKSEKEAEAIIAASNPQGRILQPEEIAETVAYCSSPAYFRRADLSGQAIELIGWSDPRLLELINWVTQNAAAAGELLIPVSGGSDSALAFYICAQAYPDKTRAVFCGTRKKLRAADWFESVGKIQYESAPRVKHGDAEILRWAKFLQLSNSANAWLVGSRNRTEEFTGLYSLASRVATFLPLAGIWKSDVISLCDAAGVPSVITASSRRADPDCGRPEALAEISIEKIDTYLRVKNGELTEDRLQSLSFAQIAYLDRVVAQNHFKWFLPTKGPALFPA